MRKMSLLDLFIGKLDPQKRKSYERLFCEEINVFLKRIHRKLGGKIRWKQIHLKPYQVKLKDLSSGESKQWVIHLMPPENLRKGDIGTVVATSNRISWDVLRNQRALFIATELYIYHAFALQKDKKWLQSIRIQNHYREMWNRFTGNPSAEHARDKAMQYLIHAIKEDKLARYSPKGMFITMKTVDAHEKDLARALGATESTFKAMAASKGKLTLRNLMKEETLLEHEIDHLSHLINLLHLDARDRRKLGQQSRRTDQHIEKLKGFRHTLTMILRRVKRWEHSRGTHRHINQLSFRFAHDHAKRELDRPRINMSKVYAVMARFQKEKLNIVRDLDALDRKLVA